MHDLASLMKCGMLVCPAGGTILEVWINHIRLSLKLDIPAILREWLRAFSVTSFFKALDRMVNNAWWAWFARWQIHSLTFYMAGRWFHQHLTSFDEASMTCRPGSNRWFHQHPTSFDEARIFADQVQVFRFLQDSCVGHVHTRQDITIAWSGRC